MIILKGAVGGGGGFSFTLTAPSAKRILQCQTPAIVVVIVMLAVVVVAMAVFGLSTLAYLEYLLLGLIISLDIVPSANSDLPPAPRALQLQPRPRTHPCPRPWSRLPLNLGSFMISPAAVVPPPSRITAVALTSNKYPFVPAD